MASEPVEDGRDRSSLPRLRTEHHGPPATGYEGDYRDALNIALSTP